MYIFVVTLFMHSDTEKYDYQKKIAVREHSFVFCHWLFWTV